jgi:hypothetical protein
MTDTVTSQNIDLSSWNTLYIYPLEALILNMDAECTSEKSATLPISTW